MSTGQIAIAAIGGLIIALVIWKAVRGGVPAAEDNDMRGTFHSD